MSPPTCIKSAAHQQPAQSRVHLYTLFTHWSPTSQFPAAVTILPIKARRREGFPDIVLSAILCIFHCKCACISQGVVPLRMQWISVGNSFHVEMFDLALFGTHLCLYIISVQPQCMVTDIFMVLPSCSSFRKILFHVNV
jgi:hypothetical protein